MVMLLEEADIRAALRWDELIVAMERALAAFSSGRVLQPVRNMLTIEEGKRYLGIMPAVAKDAMGLKLVSFYPGNAGTGVPTHMAMVPLFRPETGGPLAVMDGRLITEMRTAAVSAAVTNRLASPDSRVLALLGRPSESSSRRARVCPPVQRGEGLEQNARTCQAFRECDEPRFAQAQSPTYTRLPLRGGGRPRFLPR
jgi:hypothetical protein